MAEGVKSSARCSSKENKKTIRGWEAQIMAHRAPDGIRGVAARPDQRKIDKERVRKEGRKKKSVCRDLGRTRDRTAHISLPIFSLTSLG